MTKYEEWLLNWTEDRPPELIDAWDGAKEDAAITGVEFEQYIQEKYSAGYEEGFRTGRSTVIPEGYALVPKEELFIIIEGEDIHGEDYDKAHDTLYDIVVSLIKDEG